MSGVGEHKKGQVSSSRRTGHVQSFFLSKNREIFHNRLRDKLDYLQFVFTVMVVFKGFDTAKDIPSLEGKVILVTGGMSTLLLILTIIQLYKIS